MDKSLKEVSQNLESFIQNPNARIYTYVQTGYDETAMVATADGYLRFAQAIIDFVAAAQNGEYKNAFCGDVQGPCDSSIGRIFASISEVELDSAQLVSTEEEASKAIRYFET